MLSITAANKDVINVRHLVIEGDSQWVIGGNLLSYCNNMHLENHLAFQGGTIVSAFSQNNLCYMQIECFSLGNPSSLHANAVSVSQSLDSSAQLKIVDKVHQYVCGHSSLRDI